MQTDHNRVYKLTAERTGLDEQLYKAIGNIIFSKLYKKQRRPSTLIIKLKGIGSWYLRKKRVQEFINLYPAPTVKKFPEDLTDKFEKLTKLKYENRVEIYNTLKDRLEDYKEYIAERNIIRKKRYETQTIVESKEDS